MMGDAPPNAADLTHDILRGTLNGITFYEYDGDLDLADILPVPCEVCGAPIYIGIIASTCGDVDRNVWEDDPAIDGYSRHRCGLPPRPDEGDCPICFDEDEDDGELEIAGALSA